MITITLTERERQQALFELTHSLEAELEMAGDSYTASILALLVMKLENKEE